MTLLGARKSQLWKTHRTNLFSLTNKLEGKMVRKFLDQRIFEKHFNQMHCMDILGS